VEVTIPGALPSILAATPLTNVWVYLADGGGRITGKIGGINSRNARKDFSMLPQHQGIFRGAYSA